MCKERTQYTLLYLAPHYIFFMDYCVLNFGQLVFLLDNDVLKNNIRNIEKINKRIVHLKSGIHFNEICIQPSSMARSLPVENLLSQNVGVIIKYLQ